MRRRPRRPGASLGHRYPLLVAPLAAVSLFLVLHTLGPLLGLRDNLDDLRASTRQVLDIEQLAVAVNAEWLEAMERATGQANLSGEPVGEESVTRMSLRRLLVALAVQPANSADGAREAAVVRRIVASYSRFAAAADELVRLAQAQAPEPRRRLAAARLHTILATDLRPQLEAYEQEEEHGLLHDIVPATMRRLARLRPFVGNETVHRTTELSGLLQRTVAAERMSRVLQRLRCELVAATVNRPNWDSVEEAGDDGAGALAIWEDAGAERDGRSQAQVKRLVRDYARVRALAEASFVELASHPQLARDRQQTFDREVQTLLQREVQPTLVRDERRIVAELAAVERECRRGGFVLVLSAVLAALATAVCLVFVARGFITPIARLEAAVSKVASGDLSARVPQKGHRELDRLAVAFNRMTASLALSTAALHTAQEELEERVVQRTRELEQANRALLDEVDRRQQAFAALRQTQQRFRAIVESTSEWIWEADLQGRLTYTNPAVEGILGWRPDQLLAHRWCEMMDPDDRAQLLAAMPTEVANRRGWNGVVTRWRHLDGSVRFLESSGGAIVDQDGRVTGFRGVERDVSSREQVESELRAANVAAEEASRAKSQFVANMSHEIRTPLNGIIGMTELALDTDLTAEQREYLELARSSANALLQVVGDVLDFAKIEAGRLELEAIPFSLRRTLEEIVRAQQVVASERGLALDLRVAPEVQDLFNGDALRLRQVLVNLIGNAIKFTESGRVTVTAVAGGVSGDRREVRFAVRDTGVGIPAAAQRAIFDAFRQADGSTTRRFGGSGLGLAICRQLVELMGGRISVDSSPEEGSEFRFNAWFLDASELMNAAQAKVASIATSVSMSRELPLLRVLVAEDHPVNQRHLARLLEKLGHLPTVVPDGRAALAALERRRYHLVLMDLQMPHLDGLAATAALRERESGSGRHTPVVAVTARVMVEDRERCLAAGMDGYLAKPLRARELAAEIARLLPDVTSCQAA